MPAQQERNVGIIENAGSRTIRTRPILAPQQIGEALLARLQSKNLVLDRAGRNQAVDEHRPREGAVR